MKEVLIKQGTRAFKATENLLGQPRIHELIDKIPPRGVIFEAGRALPFVKHREPAPKVFNPDEAREVFLQ